MNWLKASPAEIDRKVSEAIRLGRGLTVSAKWVRDLLAERALLAKLAKCQDSPQFCNPMEAIAAVELRDRVLGEAQ